MGQFDFVLYRWIGAGGTALGSDSAPTLAPTSPLADNMFATPPVDVVSGNPIQSLNFAYKPSSGGGTIPLATYLWETDAAGANGAWLALGSVTLAANGVASLAVPAPRNVIPGSNVAAPMVFAFVPADNSAPTGKHEIGVIASLAVAPSSSTGGATAALQATANASLSSLVANTTGVATSANQAIANALTGTIRHATTPTKTDNATGAVEVNRRGNAFVSATARCARKLPLATAAGVQTAGSGAAGASLAEGPCDGIEVDTDSLIVHLQNPERDPIVVQSDVSWTAGAGWAIAGGVATHTGGGGTATLSQDTSAAHAADPLLATEYYAVLYTVAGRTAGSTTAKIGTAAGGTYTANGTFLDIIQAQSAVISITPSTDFDGNITLTTIWAFGGTLPLFTGNVKAESAIKVICCTSSATPGTINATAKVRANWYRRAGAVELT